MCGVEDGGAGSVGKVVLELVGMGGWACREDWRQFFWLVSAQRDERRDLRTDVEGQKAGALVLWFVVVCGGAGVDGVDGADRWSGVGAVAVEGGGVFADAKAVGVEGVGMVDEVDALDRVAVVVAVAGGVGVEDAGYIEDAGVVAVAVAVAVVEGVCAAAVIAMCGRRGASGVEDEGAGSVGEAGIVVKIAVVAAVVGVKTRGQRDARDVGGSVEFERVHRMLRVWSAQRCVGISRIRVRNGWDMDG